MDNALTKMEKGKKESSRNGWFYGASLSCLQP
jgi:hypothetical protein